MKLFAESVFCNFPILFVYRLFVNHYRIFMFDCKLLLYNNNITMALSANNFIDVALGQLSQPVCRERSPGVPRKISEKNYLGTSNFAVFVLAIRRERKSVSQAETFFEIIVISGRKFRNY